MREKTAASSGGFTLLEVLLAMFVMVSLITFSYRVYSRYIEEMKANEQVHAMQRINMYLREIYASKKLYSSDEANEVFLASVSHLGLRTSGSNVLNVYNGRLRVFPSNNGDSFTIRLEGVPRDGCVLVPAMVKEKENPVSIAVNSNSTSDFNTIISFLDANCNDDNNTVEMVFQ